MIRPDRRLSAWDSTGQALWAKGASPRYPRKNPVRGEEARASSWTLPVPAR